MQQEKGEDNQKTTFCKSKTVAFKILASKEETSIKEKIGAGDLGEMNEREKNLNDFFKKCSSWNVLRE